MDNKYFLENKVYQHKGSSKFLFYLLTFGISALVVLFYLYFDRLFPYSQLVGQVVILIFAVNVLGVFYIKKQKYERIYKSDAYVKAFYRYHVTTMPLIYVSAIHPIFMYSPTSSIINIYLRIIPAVYLILSATLLHRRTIKIFGVDNLFMYYVYHPEEGVKTESIIHSMLRHPVYSAMARFALGFGFFKGTLLSICVGLAVPLAQLFWLYVYEERDLVKRFGTGYQEYKSSVWALVIRPRDIGSFWRFLLSGGKSKNNVNM